MCQNFNHLQELDASTAVINTNSHNNYDHDQHEIDNSFTWIYVHNKYFKCPKTLDMIFWGSFLKH